MSPLAEAILSAASAALAECDGTAPTEMALLEYREDARAVAVAVLVALGGSKGKPGLEPPRSSVSQNLLGLADELDNEGA